MEKEEKMKRFKYIGSSPVEVLGKTVRGGQVVELPEDFRHPQFQRLDYKREVNYVCIQNK